MTVWYTARGAGLAALILLSFSTALGPLVSRRGAAGPRYVLQYLHRVAASLGLVVLAVHLGTILADPYAHVGWRGALVPFTSGYRPAWVGLGTLAVTTFLFVATLGLARGRMASSPRGARVWRGLHSLAYLGWFAAIWHGFMSGTDSSLGWVRVLYLACLGAVLAAVAVRLVQFGAQARSAARPRANAGPPVPTSRFAPARTPEVVR